MRGLLLLLPIALMAQATAPAPQPAKPKPAAVKPAAPKPAVAAKPKPAEPAELATDEEKAIYSLGLSIYRSLSQFDLSPAEVALVIRGLSDSAAGKPAVDITIWGPKIQQLAKERGQRAAAREKANSKAYLDKAAAEPGAVRTESGLIYREVKAGTGDPPKATDQVKVHYRGTLINGTEFDSSYRRNQPAQFGLNGVIKCWTEGVQKMKPGGKSMLICPSDLAYGDRAQPSIPAGSTLIFEVELLEIVAPATK